MKTLSALIGILVLGALTTRANPPPPVTRVEMRPEGLYVNGEPFFPVGIAWAAHWHCSLPEAGAQGFNLVTTCGTNPATYRADIDDAYANGMYASVSLMGVCENLKALEPIVMACRDAPGLLVWELEDEPNIRTAGSTNTPHADKPYRLSPAKLKPAHDLIERLDPLHPVYVNLAYGYAKDHRDYRVVADIQSDNTYPVPDAPLNWVARYADAVVEGSAGKPGWLWVQMAPLKADSLGKDDRAPTMAEVRCMTYMAVAHGISGVSYFAFHYAADWWVNESPTYWAQWADLTAELRRLTPYLVAPTAAGKVEAEIVEGSKEPGNFGYPALHLSLRQTAGGYFLIAVNGLNSPIKARITVPVGGIGSNAAVRSEHRLIGVNGGMLEDSFGPYEVHLYDLPLSEGHKVDRTNRKWPR